MPKNKTGTSPTPDSPTIYRRKKLNRINSNRTKQDKIAHVTYCTNPLALRWRRILDCRRSVRRQALSSASAPLSTPRCHMPTFFAAVTQSRPSLITTPNATHFRPLPLRGTAPKASRFFWRQSSQDVAGRPPRLGPCTASRPNTTRFESLESPCRIRATGEPKLALPNCRFDPFGTGPLESLSIR